MIEQDLREGLTGALAGEPPLSFDPDRLVARAQREIRRRRSLVGVGGATAVIAVLAATVLHPTAPNTAAAPHLTTAAAPAQPPDFPWPPAGIHPKVYSAAEEKPLAAAWTQHLTQTFGAVVPGASQVAVEPWGGESGGTIATGQDYLDTYVNFTFHGVPTAVAIQVAAPGQYTLSLAKSCGESTSPDKCVFTPTADGGLLLYFDIVQGDMRLRSVTDFRPDGTVVFATGYNYDPTSTAQHVQLSVPLTDAQLTTFATDPMLAF